MFILWFSRTGFSVFCLYVSKYVHRQTRVQSSFLKSSNSTVYPCFWKQGPNSQVRERVWNLMLSWTNQVLWFCSWTGWLCTWTEGEAWHAYTWLQSCALPNASGASSGTGSDTPYIQMPAAKQASQNDPFMILFTLNMFEDSYTRFSFESAALTLFAAWLPSGAPPPVTGWLVSSQRLLTTAWRGVL